MTTRGRLRGALALGVAASLLACGGSLESDSPARRAAAVRALASRRGDAPVPALLVAQRDPSPLVRRAAVEVIAQRKGPHTDEALGSMLADPDAEVASAAALGLARLGDLAAARTQLIEGYALAAPAGRAAIATALDELGVSLRDAVEAESRHLWTRNLAVLSNASPEAMAGAIEELGASGRTEAVARLRTILEAPGADIRIAMAALRALGEAGDESVRPLLEREMARSDHEIAEAAASALGRLGDPAATPALARLAAAGAAGLHRAALEALAALPAAPEVSQALCGVAVRSQSPAIAVRAARAAWGRNADCPASALAARAARGETAAQEAIVELHPEATVVGPLASKLASVVGDARASSERRTGAATLIGQLGWSAAAPALEARARLVRDRLLAARVGWIPGRFADEATLPSDPAQRLAFLRDRPATLPRRVDEAPSGVPEWIDLTSPDDREELGALLTALGRLQSVSAAPLLHQCARDPSAPVRAGAIEGIGHMGGTDPDPELLAALDDPSDLVRYAALRVLPRYGPRAVPPLAAAVGRSGERTARWRDTLAHALGQTGAPEALAPLAALLSGTAASEAAAGIAAIGVAAGADPLLAHLARKEAPGRVQVLEALAQLASRSAGPAIEAELLSDRADVRAAAARAIGKLRYEPASNRLEALRVDYDGRVRRAAIEALARLPSGRPKGP